MRIAIDITPLETGHKDRGTGVYVKNIIEALEKYDRQNSYTFFIRKQNIPKNADLVYYPYFDVFFHTLPVFHVKPQIVTVHDIIPVVFPDKFPSGIKGKAGWNLQKIALRHSDRIMASSGSTKKDLVYYTGIRPELIDVVYLAASVRFNERKSRKISDEVVRKYALPGKYIMYVGDLNWNKNVTGLINAFAEFLKLEPGLKYKLVLVGKAFINRTLKETEEINRQISSLDIRGSVVLTGFVDMDDLKYVYQNAALYIQPSHYEGFGLPVLEAMSCGCPCAVADNSSLSEIAGPALRFNPGDEKDMALFIRKSLMTDSTRRKLQIEKQNKWVKNFVWEKTVEGIKNTYEKVIGINNK